MNLRPLYMLLAIVLVLWVLIPIFLIATLAFSDRASVFAWPKGLLPQQFSLETISFFFGVEGVWKAIRNSLVVAAMTLVFSVLLGPPPAMPWPATGLPARMLTAC